MGTGRAPTWPLQKSWSGQHREGEESKPMKHGQEKSDLFIIELKPTNKPGRLGAELVEPRERTEGNMGEQHTYRTLRRIKRVPEARLCTRSCSWDSSLTTRGGSPVRESRPPGSVRGASSNGCPYRHMYAQTVPIRQALRVQFLQLTNFAPRFAAERAEPSIADLLKWPDDFVGYGFNRGEAHYDIRMLGRDSL